MRRGQGQERNGAQQRGAAVWSAATILTVNFKILRASTALLVDRCASSWPGRSRLNDNDEVAAVGKLSVHC